MPCRHVSSFDSGNQINAGAWGCLEAGKVRSRLSQGSFWLCVESKTSRELRDMRVVLILTTLSLLCLVSDGALTARLLQRLSHISNFLTAEELWFDQTLDHFSPVVFICTLIFSSLLWSLFVLLYWIDFMIESEMKVFSFFEFFSYAFKLIFIKLETPMCSCFGLQDHRKFQQRYYQFTDYFRLPDGPIFLKICGESSCDGIANDYLGVSKRGFMLFSFSCLFRSKIWCSHEVLGGLWLLMLCEDTVFFSLLCPMQEFKSVKYAPMSTDYAGSFKMLWIVCKYGLNDYFELLLTEDV